MINQMTIIGLGFIGKSIAKAIHNTSFTKSIVGFDEDITKAEDLLADKILNHARSDFESAVKNADLIIITSSFEQYEQIFTLLAKNIKETTTITDMESIKIPVIDLARKKLGKHFTQFVPSHPITHINKRIEKSIPMPDIFAERPVIITPEKETLKKSLKLVIRFWQKMGGETEVKSAAENDAILAMVSHLPQILAFTFINSLNEDNIALRYITKNFIDFTSIATQSPIIWRDMCIANRQAILKELIKFESNLVKIKKILETENNEILLEHFNNVKQLRESM